MVLTGSTATALRERDEEIPITGRALPAERLALDRLFTTNVFSRQTGSAIPLIQIASLRAANSFGVITRRDHAPTLTVQANSMTKTATELEGAVEAKIDEIQMLFAPFTYYQKGPFSCANTRSAYARLSPEQRAELVMARQLQATIPASFESWLKGS